MCRIHWRNTILIREPREPESDFPWWVSGRWSPPVPIAILADDSWQTSAMASKHFVERMETIVVIGIGGFAGSNLRYFVELTVPSSLLATATVNTLGCLALGFLFYERRFAGTISQSGRTLLATGFIASFTTYSTFILDAITATPAMGLAYVTGSYVLGFAAVVFGREAAQWATSVGEERA